MNFAYLQKIFNPQSIAVIGASNREGSVGHKVFSNLITGEYPGQLFAVNPKYDTVQGMPCYARIKEIKQMIDLAIITTPVTVIPDILHECGTHHIQAVLILSAGFSETGEQGTIFEQKILITARKYQIRIMGPNCLGLMLPHLKINATFNNVAARAGNIALVSQSGAICAAILDWAYNRNIGFSMMASIGNAIDIDFSNLLDYLALDTTTSSILLYIEGIKNARHFLSSLRIAARMKPVIVIKAGRHRQGSKAAISHTGALMGADDVFDSALHRAGVVRVYSIFELFTAAEILANLSSITGNSMTIITNGGGAGVMAADRAADLNIPLANLNAETFARLNKVLPFKLPPQNPIDLRGDATPLRFKAVIKTVLLDANCDLLLVILVPVGMTDPTKVAHEIITETQKAQKPAIACWMGEKQVKKARQLFMRNYIPNFPTPEIAIDAYSYLIKYQYSQELLLQVPPPSSHEVVSDLSSARTMIDTLLAQKRHILTMLESKKILAAFNIPVSKTLIAVDLKEALTAAKTLGYPVVMKILSPDITHKQDVGGVQLNIADAATLENSYKKMIAEVKRLQPQAKIMGVTLEKMQHYPSGRELMIGVIRDKVFGPAISFGAGGSMVEILEDHAVALPPLNYFLAKQLISRTRVSKLLGQFRNLPAINLDLVINTLLAVSEMVCEIPEIRELDINPIVFTEDGLMALDARLIIDAEVNSEVPYSHMAIHPYPRQLISEWQLTEGTTVYCRPIKPEDAAAQQSFILSLSEESKYFRFMQAIHELTPQWLVRFTQIDYDREMALLAFCKENNQEIALAIARYYILPDQETCEFALVVADRWQHKGIGRQLLNNLINIAKTKGIKKIFGEVLTSNYKMLTLMHDLNFNIIDGEQGSNIKIVAKVI